MLYTADTTACERPQSIVPHAFANDTQILGRAYLLSFGDWCTVEMDRMSDYDIRSKPKVWASSPNECRTFGRTSAECCMVISVKFLSCLYSVCPIFYIYIFIHHKMVAH